MQKPCPELMQNPRSQSDSAMTEPQSPSQPPTLSTVLGESLRIMKSLFPQLLFICFLSVFPKSFSSIAYPTRLNLIRAKHPFPDKYQPEALLALFFCGFNFFFSLSGFVFYSLGLWDITRWVFFHGFYPRPAKPTKDMCKPVSVSFSISFLSLLGTVLIAIPNWVTLFNLVDLGQSMFRAFRGASESQVDMVRVAFVIGYVNVNVHHALAVPIVVLESGGLLQSLTRSSKLMKGKGKRMIALWMLLIFGSFSVVLGFISSWILEAQLSLYGDLSGGGWWRMVTPQFILRIVMASIVFMMVLLSNAVANTVLYAHCTKEE